MVFTSFRVQTFGAFGGSDSGSERIAGIKRHIHHAAALHPVARTPRARGKSVALNIAIISRIRIDQAAHGAMLRRNLGFDPAP